MIYPASRPLVSILCTAYNHEAFIRKALESFLEQKVSFKYEVIVHDDASTDRTTSIIKEFENKYPTIIKGIYQTENQHSKARGSVARILYSAASGKYIAFCEGDDHWIDNQKLQRQIDALEGDASAIGCFTDAFNERDGERESYMGPYASTPKKEKVEQRDLIRGQGIPTCTFVFRNIDLRKFHEARRLSPVGDALLFIFLTNHGYLIYQPERTGVRVIHTGGIHSLTTDLHKLKVDLAVLPFMDQLSGHKYTELLILRKRRLLNNAWSEAITHQNRELAKYVWPRITKDRSWYGWNFTTLLRNFFKAYWPWPDRMLSQLMRA